MYCLCCYTNQQLSKFPGQSFKLTFSLCLLLHNVVNIVQYLVDSLSHFVHVLSQTVPFVGVVAFGCCEMACLVVCPIVCLFCLVLHIVIGLMVKRVVERVVSLMHLITWLAFRYPGSNHPVLFVTSFS